MPPEPINNREGTFKRLALSGPQEGDFAEFGVYSGGSTRFLAQFGRRVWAFDTFQGLPETCYNKDVDGTQNPPGKFTTNGIPQLLLNTQVIIPMVGEFKYTLPKMWGLTKFALVYLDCDYYESYQQVFATLPYLLVPGAGVVTDDYAALPAVKRAIDEFVERWGLTLHDQEYFIWRPNA